MTADIARELGRRLSLRRRPRRCACRGVADGLEVAAGIRQPVAALVAQ